MNRRSLELNFENNFLLYSAHVSQQIRQRQNVYLGTSINLRSQLSKS